MRFSRTLPINRTTPFDPNSLYTGNGAGLQIKSQDRRSLTLRKLDFGRVVFPKQPSYWRASMACKIHCLEEEGYILLDAAIGQALWQNYCLMKSRGRVQKSVLMALQRRLGISYIDFPGTIVKGQTGRQYVVCLYLEYDSWVDEDPDTGRITTEYSDETYWKFGYFLIDNPWNDMGREFRSACLRGIPLIPIRKR